MPMTLLRRVSSAADPDRNHTVFDEPAGPSPSIYATHSTVNGSSDSHEADRKRA